MKNGLWRGAVLCWVVAIVMVFIPTTANAAVFEFGDMRFTFSQAFSLFAVGLAWGDMRQWRASVDARLKKLEE